MKACQFATHTQSDLFHIFLMFEPFAISSNTGETKVQTAWEVRIFEDKIHYFIRFQQWADMTPVSGHCRE